MMAKLCTQYKEAVSLQRVNECPAINCLGKIYLSKDSAWVFYITVMKC